ncbi:MAG: hypothetical protein ACREPH_13025 [Rhodanobacteraceae bacterium]
MTDTDDKQGSAALRREIRWDAVAAIIASVVGLLALIVAGYTAYIQRYTAQLQREQVRAQVWPRLQIEGSLASSLTEIKVLNQGVGPAIIQSVEVLVAGKPVSNWIAYLKMIGSNSTTTDTITITELSQLNGAVLRPGETFDWLQFANRAGMEIFILGGLHAHAEFRVCYASALGQSWMLIQRGAHQTTQPVSSCPKLSARDEFGVPMKSVLEGVQHERQPATGSS